MQPRGKATRGQVARAVAGAEAIEIKATVPDHQVRQALAHFGLTTRNDEVRLIYFFDTPALELLAAGIIARARRAIGDEHDSTVKFRPVDPGRIGARWRKFRGFKIEVDASEKALVKAASFSMPVAKGCIKRVAAGRKPVEALFSAEQEEFLMTVAGRRIDFGTLAVLGPLRAQRWRVEDPACPWPITAELWRRDDGQQLMEVSIKAPILQAAVAIGGFMAYLAEVGAERDDQEQTKTRWALAHYADRLAQAPAPTRSARERPTQQASARAVTRPAGAR
jgi:nitrogen fixation protein FixH